MKMRVLIRALALVAAAPTAIADGPISSDDAHAAAVGAERRSGYFWLTPETQRLQDDEFANPGMLWVEAGNALWNLSVGASGKSCASCHGNAAQSMRTVATRYPAYSRAVAHVINLEQQVNRCRTLRQRASAFVYESKDLLALTAFISYQARGLPMNVAIDGPATQSYERGKAFFNTRRGQLNLSCANCHEQHAGGHLRGEPITQGQVNGFPIYRLLWQATGSTHRMFAWCNEAVRAEPFAAGSQPYVDLELFERWRGRGLPIETPAIRR
jgi:sulfur-oxidizing protein SoxA